jgi:hypothetical protein
VSEVVLMSALWSARVIPCVVVAVCGSFYSDLALVVSSRLVLCMGHVQRRYGSATFDRTSQHRSSRTTDAAAVPAET